MVDLARSLGVGTIGFQYLSTVDEPTRKRTNKLMGEPVIEAHTFADLRQDMLRRGEFPVTSCQRCCVTHESEAPLLKRVAAKLRPGA